MSSIERQQSYVKESLFSFLQKNCLDETCLSAIDDIVLSYVTGVLDNLGAEGVDCFEVEQFVEMMGAYFPGFMDVDISAVCEWLFKLAAKLSEMKLRSESESSSDDSYQPNEVRSSYIHLYLRPAQSKDAGSAGTSPPKSSDGDQLASSHEEGVVERSESVEDDELDGQVQRLHEMFPNVCILEMTRCLAIADGCPERAAQLIIHRLDNHESLDSTALLSVGRKFRNITLDDKQLKENILSRYAFVDKAEDERDHKPITPKTEPKKLIRYRDNKVVSIKGEKFSEIKRGDDDDESVGKSTATVSRQFRLH